MAQNVPIAVPPRGIAVEEAATHAHAADHAVEHGQSLAERNENQKFGMWLFLASEIILFTVLISAYVFARFAYPEQHSLLNIPLTSLATFILLVSSFTVVRALAAVEEGDNQKFLRSLALTMILGFVFLGIQAYEYSHLGHLGLTLSGDPSKPSSVFGMAFYALTGFHGLHVTIGVLWAVRVFWRAFNGKYTQHDHFGVEFFGLYWHFVDVVWIIIFTLVYLI